MKIQSNIQYSSSALADQTANSLGIITAGITLFTLFGGILSVINIFLSRDLYRAVDEAKKAKESQKELNGFRLLQEGRAYKNNERYVYAENKFKELIFDYKNSMIALQAQYELIDMYAQLNSIENIKEVEDKVKYLLKSIRTAHLNTIDCNNLEADTHYLLGCIYGNYYTTIRCNEYLDKSIKEFKSAIRCDSQNADVIRNLSISYAMKSDWESCVEAIDEAKSIAEEIPLYKSFVENGRLGRMFQPYIDYISPEILHRIEQKINFDFSFDAINCFSR
jgi:tetratricopeptide (TPR) repeat protein